MTPPITAKMPVMAPRKAFGPKKVSLLSVPAAKPMMAPVPAPMPSPTRVERPRWASLMVVMPARG